MNLQEQLQSAKSILVVTGAGISVASGIAAFRKDKDAVWENDVVTMGTFSFFKEDPVASWTWYRRRFADLVEKQPNAAHYALTQLEQWSIQEGKGFLLITQNIDTLHRKAGSEAVVEIHGRTDCVRCSNSDCLRGEPLGRIEPGEFDFSEFDSDPCFQSLPKCAICGSPVRAHVLWFDEMYDGHADYQYERSLVFAFEAELILFVGTSFSVGITDNIWRVAMHRRIPVFAIDPSPSKDYPNINWIEERSELYLPQLMKTLQE